MPSDLSSRLKELIGRRLIITFLLFLSILTYVTTFLWIRQGANSAGYPLMYIFSTNAIENDQLMIIFTPIIWISGGRATSSDYEKASADELPRSDGPVYLRSNHRMWSRISSHFETLQDLQVSTGVRCDCSIFKALPRLRRPLPLCGRGTTCGPVQISRDS